MEIVVVKVNRDFKDLRVLMELRGIKVLLGIRESRVQGVLEEMMVIEDHEVCLEPKE